MIIVKADTLPSRTRSAFLLILSIGFILVNTPGSESRCQLLLANISHVNVVECWNNSKLSKAPGTVSISNNMVTTEYPL